MSSTCPAISLPAPTTSAALADMYGSGRREQREATITTMSLRSLSPKRDVKRQRLRRQFSINFNYSGDPQYQQYFHQRSRIAGHRSILNDLPRRVQSDLRLHRRPADQCEHLTDRRRPVASSGRPGWDLAPFPGPTALPYHGTMTFRPSADVAGMVAKRHLRLGCAATRSATSSALETALG